MKYCVFGKGKGASKMADQVVTKMLQEYSRQLFGFTRAEFDSIDRKSTRLNSSHLEQSRMPSSA